MLIASKRKIRLSQSIYVLLVSTFLVITIIPIMIQINSILFQNDFNLDMFASDDNREQITALGAVNMIFFNNPIFFIIPLIFGILTVIFYIPTLSSLGLVKFKGQKNIRINNSRLFEYGYTIPINDIQIRINRKLNSVKGLFMRELDFQIILPSDYKEDKRLFDFLACEQVFYSSRQIILKKRVDIQNIPLLFFRTQVLLSTSH